jgi:chorismate synthase
MTNSMGTLFRITTWGESHGPALGCVIDGCPAGLPLDRTDLESALQRDVPDRLIGTPRGEMNRCEILSGVFAGRTIGTPISLIVWNNDARPASYDSARDTLRPGHADFTWLARFGHTDYRGGARASGRECIARLAAGAVAMKLAEMVGVRFSSRPIEMAGKTIAGEDDYELARAEILKHAEAGDSTGGIVALTIRGMPPGIGAPVFGKLQADLGRALLSIGGIKACEFGEGLAAARARGSTHNDPFHFGSDGQIETTTNLCGGLLGGISTGQDITIRLVVKPTPTIRIPQQTVHVGQKEPVTMRYEGRFDANYTPRVGPIAEAMAALVLVDHLIMSGLLPPTRLRDSAPGSP